MKVTALIVLAIAGLPLHQEREIHGLVIVSQDPAFQKAAEARHRPGIPFSDFVRETDLNRAALEPFGMRSAILLDRTSGPLGALTSKLNLLDSLLADSQDGRIMADRLKASTRDLLEKRLRNDLDRYHLVKGRLALVTSLVLMTDGLEEARPQLLESDSDELRQWLLQSPVDPVPLTPDEREAERTWRERSQQLERSTAFVVHGVAQSDPGIVMESVARTSGRLISLEVERQRNLMSRWPQTPLEREALRGLPERTVLRSELPDRFALRLESSSGKLSPSSRIRIVRVAGLRFFQSTPGGAPVPRYVRLTILPTATEP